MGLQDIARGARAAIAWNWLGSDPAQVTEVQQRMVQAGLLDGADGEFAAVSRWAVAQWIARMGLHDAGRLDGSVASGLLSGRALEVFALRTEGSGLASRVAAALVRLGHLFCRHPDAMNIVYVEGLDPERRAQGHAPHQIHDLRMVLRCNDAGQPVLVESWAATSEPGRCGGKHHADAGGAARIAFGQYKAWSVGTHMAGRPFAHEAQNDEGVAEPPCHIEVTFLNASSGSRHFTFRALARGNAPGMGLIQALQTPSPQGEPT